MAVGAVALLAGGCGDGDPSPTVHRSPQDRPALLDQSGAELSLVNRDRLLAGTRWQSRADSIGTWPLDTRDRAQLPSLRQCAHGAEIGWAFRAAHPLGHAETDIRAGRHGGMAIVEIFAPLQSLGRHAIEQGMSDGVTRCASGHRRLTQPLAGRWHEIILNGRPAAWRLCRAAGAWHALLYQADARGTSRRDVAELVNLIRSRIDSSCAV
jgi:hypothetical protein